VQGHEIGIITMYKKVLLGIAFILVTGITSANDKLGQVRDLYIGMPITDLAENQGYFFRCSDGKKLEKINEYQVCPTDEQGFIQLNVIYNNETSEWGDVNDKWLGTKLAGHPVIINSFINANGEIERIDVQTDPNSRMYMKKKSFLLGQRIKNQFGENFWMCTKRQQDDEIEVGGMLIDELCRKDFHGFSVVTHIELFYKLTDGKKQYINSTKFSLLATS
jgi:hypothetical protein